MIQCRLCNFQYTGETKRRLKDRFNEHRRPILNPSGSYIQTAVSEHFLSNSRSVSYMLFIPVETLIYERDCLRKAPPVRRTSFIKPKPSSLWDWINVTNNNHCELLCNLYLFFGLLFLAATPYHVIPCNFRLLFYSSIYSVYSWSSLVNLMKTGVGQSKYCTVERKADTLWTKGKCPLTGGVRLWEGAKKMR